MSAGSLRTDHIVRIGQDNPVLIDTVRPSSPDGVRFDVWYAKRHLPQHPADRPIRRYLSVSSAAAMYIQELDPASVALGKPSALRQALAQPLPPSPIWHERAVGHPLGITRQTAVGPEVIDAAHAYPVFFKVPLDWQSEFNRWYEEEHLPMLLECPHWVMCRRFVLEDQGNCEWTHVAIHYLSDLHALQSSERDAARSTPWRDRLAAQAWYTPEYRVFYRVTG